MTTSYNESDADGSPRVPSKGCQTKRQSRNQRRVRSVGDNAMPNIVIWTWNSRRRSGRTCFSSAEGSSLCLTNVRARSDSSARNVTDGRPSERVSSVLSVLQKAVLVSGLWRAAYAGLTRRTVQGRELEPRGQPARGSSRPRRDPGSACQVDGGALAPDEIARIDARTR